MVSFGRGSDESLSSISATSNLRLATQPGPTLCRSYEHTHQQRSGSRVNLPPFSPFPQSSTMWSYSNSTSTTGSRSLWSERQLRNRNPGSATSSASGLDSTEKSATPATPSRSALSKGSSSVD